MESTLTDIICVTLCLNSYRCPICDYNNVKFYSYRGNLLKNIIFCFHRDSNSGFKVYTLARAPAP